MTPPRSYELVHRLPSRGPGERWRGWVFASAGPPLPVDVELLDRRWSERPGLVAAIRHDRERIAALGHPGLPASADLTRLDGRLAVVEPVPDGFDLSFLDQADVPVVLAIVAQVAHALDGLAELEVPHGSLAPAAITVNREGRVQLHGAGLVRAELPAWSPETGSLVRLDVSPLAPEQLAQARLAPTSAGDVYALGALAAGWVLARRLGPARMRPREHRAAVAARLAALSHLALRSLLVSMLAWDPEARPSPAEVRQRASDLLATLDPGSLEAWAAAHLPSADRLATPTGGRRLVETPWSSETPTAHVPRRGPYAVDPAGTLDPVPLEQAADWNRLRDESLRALQPDPSPAGPASRPPVPWVAAAVGLAGLGMGLLGASLGLGGW